jgi:hypothetical protein
MAFDFAQARELTRRTVHDTMRVAGSYVAPGGSSGTDLYVRWHHKMGLSGDIDNAGYAQMMVGIEVVIFDKAELAEKGVALERGGEITLSGGVVLSLGAKHPDDGPVKEVWSVALK